MFTTIANLRKSNADQPRVSTVEKWLLKQNPKWEPTFIFPIFAIANSNSVDDVDWVFDETRCHEPWPEMQAAVMRKIATDGIAIDDHARDILRRLRRSKASTVAELTKLYKEAYLEAYPDQNPVADFGSAPKSLFASSGDPAKEGSGDLHHEGNELSDTALVDSAVEHISELISDLFTLPLSKDHRDGLTAMLNAEPREFMGQLNMLVDLARQSEEEIVGDEEGEE